MVGGMEANVDMLEVPKEKGENLLLLARDQKGNEGSNKYEFACVFVASMISILMGYDIGVMSGAMLYIKEDLKIKDGEIEVLAGIINICALLGSLTAGRISDLIGRRYTISLAASILFLGSLLMGFAPSFPALITGRCVAGIGVGYALMIAPVYAAEISSPSARGLLMSLPEICISCGILLGYVSNYAFSKLPLVYTWRSMLGVAAVPAAALAVGVLAMPESPRWLVMQGLFGDARGVLLRVSDTPEEADQRLQEIKAAAGIDGHSNKTSQRPRCTRGVWTDLIIRPTPPVRRILIAAIGIHFFEHATGIEAVVLYSPRIFKMSGIVAKNDLLIATLGVGITKICFILVAAALLDRVGRRSLLLTSVAGMVVSLAGLGFGLTMAGRVEERLMWAVVVCIACVYSFVGFFSIGLGPITWVYSSEIFPSRLRAQGASLGVAVNRMMNGVVSMTFISLYKAISIGGAFFMFAGIGVLAWLFFYYFCPETRGRSLEEMEEVFGRECHSSLVNGEGCEMKRMECEKQSLI